MIPDGVKFCPICGAKQPAAAAHPPPPPPAQYPQYPQNQQYGQYNQYQQNYGAPPAKESPCYVRQLQGTLHAKRVLVRFPFHFADIYCLRHCQHNISGCNIPAGDGVLCPVHGCKVPALSRYRTQRYSGSAAARHLGTVFYTRHDSDILSDICDVRSIRRSW